MLLIFFNPASAEEDTKEKTPDSLVASMGSDSFQQRQAAMNRLLEIGLPAMSAVDAGASHDDFEIRSRCRLVLRVLIDLERKQLIDRFLRTKSIDESLPGWNDFKRIAGESPSTRQLFAEMLKSDWDLMEKCYSVDASGCGQLIVHRCYAIQRAFRYDRARVSTSRLSTILLAAGKSDVVVPNASVIFGLCSRSEVHSSLVVGEHAATMRHLLDRVVAQQHDASSNSQCLYLSLRYRLPAGLPIARDAIGDPTSQSYVRLYALQLIGKLGTSDDIKLVEPLLDDETICVRLQKIQIRDAALATLAIMANENPKEYGLSKIRLDRTNLFSVTSIGFESEAARAAGIQRWRNRTNTLANTAETKPALIINAPISKAEE